MRVEEEFSPRVCATRFPAITIPSSYPGSARHLRIVTTRLFRWIMVIASFANIIVGSSHDDNDGEGRAQHLKSRGKTSSTRVCCASRRNENKAREDRWRIDIADETPCLTLCLHCRRAWSSMPIYYECFLAALRYFQRYNRCQKYRK